MNSDLLTIFSKYRLPFYPEGKYITIYLSFDSLIKTLNQEDKFIILYHLDILRFKKSTARMIYLNQLLYDDIMNTAP